MRIPITQSEAWQNLQNDLKEPSFFEKSADYQYLAIKKHTPVGNYLYLPYGPVADTQAGFNHALKSLRALASREACFFIRIEPQNPRLKLPGNAQKSKDLSPAETWVLDISREDYQKLYPSRLFRYYKNREKQGLTITTSHNPADIHYLLDLQKQLARKKHISTFSEDYLKTELSQTFATLYLCKQGSGVLAAGLVFDDATTRYNLQGAQSDAGRAHHATGILTIALIEDAKRKGLQTFDFWGIAPENARRNHPWAGFTAFKKTFAGEERKYLGTHDLVLSQPRYALYKLLRRLHR